MTSALINGRSATLPDDSDALLVDVLRDDLRLTGTKLVRGAGVCGACTVLVDGAPVVSCLLPAKAVAGKTVTTVEGIGAGKLHPVQRAFMALDALQCGFCTPGFIVEATAFHDAWRAARGAATPTRPGDRGARSPATSAAAAPTTTSFAQSPRPALADTMATRNDRRAWKRVRR